MSSETILTEEEKIDKKKFIQFSKILISVILILCGLWITWSYVLATISLFKNGDSSLLEELSKQITLTILGTSIGYFTKSFCENYSKGKQELEMSKLGQEVITNETESEEESVG